MTNITESELKLLYIEIVIVAIMGVFLYFYNQSPIESTVPNVGTLSGANQSSSSTVAWSTTLVDNTLGLRVGSAALLIVSSIFLIPMTIMNALVIARLAKDFVTQWI